MISLFIEFQSNILKIKPIIILKKQIFYDKKIPEGQAHAGPLLAGTEVAQEVQMPPNVQAMQEEVGQG